MGEEVSEHGQNDNTDELKRKRRSLMSKIDRREVAIFFAKNELRRLDAELRIVEATLAERKAGK